MRLLNIQLVNTTTKRKITGESEVFLASLVSVSSLLCPEVPWLALVSGTIVAVHGEIQPPVDIV